MDGEGSAPPAAGRRVEWGRLRCGCGRRWRRGWGLGWRCGDPGGWVLARGGGAAPPGRRAAGVRQGRRARAEPRQSRRPPRRGPQHGPAPPLGPGSPPALVARPARLGRPGLRGRRRRPTHPAVAARPAPAGPGDGRHHGHRPDPGPAGFPMASASRTASSAGAAWPPRTPPGRRPGRLDPWAARHLDRLADLEAGWRGPGARPCSSDLRATTCSSPRPGWWPSTGRGRVSGRPGSMLLLLPSVTMQGGPDPAAISRPWPPGPASGRRRRLPAPPPTPGLSARAGRGRPRLAGGTSDPPARETSGLDEGPAQLLQPGCRPLSALVQAR